MYIGEVSPPSVHGNLGALFQLSICVRVLALYLLGTYISYWQVAFVCAGVSAVQLFLMFTIAESPRLSRNPLKNIRTRLSKQRINSVEARCSKDMTLNAGPMSQKKTFYSHEISLFENCSFCCHYDVSAVRWSKCNGIICWSNFSHSKA